MKNRLGLIILIIIILLEIIFCVFILTGLINTANFVSLTFSMIALILSLVSSFKNELFPFRLSAFIDGFYLVSAGSIESTDVVTVQVLLPITFFNTGYSEGRIQTIYLSVGMEEESTIYKFIPAVEIDMTAFVQQGKGINQSNILGMFTGFLLESKRAIKKYIVFYPENTLNSPTFIWKPGYYTFSIYIHTYGESRPVHYCSVKHNIGPNVLNMLLSGQVKSLYLYPE